MNYYFLLNVDKSATAEEIKKAFRKKLKVYHPDINSEQKAMTHKDGLIAIIDAYTVLSNPLKRKHYDAQQMYQCHETVGLYKDIYKRNLPKSFDYESFLLKRIDQWHYKIKFFLYDLLFHNGERAVAIYEILQKCNQIGKIEEILGYHDFFDSLFLVAEYYQLQSTIESYNKALVILNRIGIMEQKKPYFKSYMEEVAERVLLILGSNFMSIDVYLIKELLEHMKDWAILPTQKNKAARFLKKLDSFKSTPARYTGKDNDVKSSKDYVS